MRKKGHPVPPMSTKKIRGTALKLRKILGVFGAPVTGQIDVIKVVDVYLPRYIDRFILNVVPNDELGGDDAVTYPDRFEIILKENTYLKANKGGAHVFTVAHEIGHLVMHGGVASYSRNVKSIRRHELYEDSEWQADVFAAEFLMPYEDCVECRSWQEIKMKFPKVSDLAAKIRFEKIQRGLR